MPYSVLNPPFQGEDIPYPGAQPSSAGVPASLLQAQAALLTRAPGGAQSTLLAPGLAVLAAALSVGGVAPVQGMAAHVIGDFFPADVRVDVMVRQVLWWHRARRHVRPPSPGPLPLLPHRPMPPPPTDPHRWCCSRNAAG